MLLQQNARKYLINQEHCFSVRIINPLTNGQMVIKLAANNFLSQNDFLIWEELLLCEKYIFWIFDAKHCSVPGNHWMLIWACRKNSSTWKSEVFLLKNIFGILRRIISFQHCCSFEHTVTNFLNETSEYWRTLFHLWKEVSSHITTKLHFTQGIWTLYYNCIIAWLIEIDFVQTNGTLFLFTVLHKI